MNQQKCYIQDAMGRKCLCAYLKQKQNITMKRRSLLACPIVFVSIVNGFFRSGKNFITLKTRRTRNAGITVKLLLAFKNISHKLQRRNNQIEYAAVSNFYRDVSIGYREHGITF